MPRKLYRFRNGPPGCNGDAEYVSEGRAINAAKITLRNRARGPNDMLTVECLTGANDVPDFVCRVVFDGGGENIIVERQQ